MDRHASLQQVKQPEFPKGHEEIVAALDSIDTFLSQHPEIERSTSDLAVPHDCRAQFYEMLAGARSTMVRQAVDETVARQAQRTIEGLLDARQRLAAMTGLSHIYLPSGLQAFCENPFLGSSRALLSPLLSYVQNSIKTEELLQKAALTAEPTFKQFGLSAYETWMAFEALCLLKPKKAWAVELNEKNQAVAIATSSLEVGQQHYHVTLRLPECVLECESGLYGIKFELASEIDFYDSKPRRRRDFSSGGDTRNLIGRRYLMVYKLATLDAIPAIADRDREYLLAPHALLATIRAADMDESVYALGSIARMQTLSPRRGSFFLALDGCAERFCHLASDYDVSLQAENATFNAKDVAPFAALLNAPKIGDTHENPR